MKHSFFTYGAFSKGQVHYSKFSKMIVGRKKAFVKANAYRLHCGYPILDTSKTEELIAGTLVELEAPESFWSVLDGLLGVDQLEAEKGFLKRCSILTMIDSFTSIKAQTYCINPKKLTKAHKKINRYQWPHEINKELKILTKLNDRHRQFLSRLSKVRGRDIVPIELDIYRELLSMDIIVDRGRRLALTPLGKEVCLFKL